MERACRRAECGSRPVSQTEKIVSSDVLVGLLDPARHSGSGWWQVRHPVGVGQSVAGYCRFVEAKLVRGPKNCRHAAGFFGTGLGAADTRHLNVRQIDRITLLICIQPSSNAVVHHKIVKGSMNAVLFQEFLSCLPVFCQGKRLLLDNARIHHATHACRAVKLPTIQETANSKGLLLSYLPAYSPQYNPTELVFARLKKRVRFKPWEEVTIKSLGDRLDVEMENLGDTNAMFKKCLDKLL